MLPSAEGIEHPEPAAGLRADAELDDQASPPHRFELEAAPGAEPLEAAVDPGGRQGRQDLYEAPVGLQEHLRNAGRAAEVPVDLEGRVGVEEIFQRGMAEQGQQVPVGRLGSSSRA